MRGFLLTTAIFLYIFLFSSHKSVFMCFFSNFRVQSVTLSCKEPVCNLDGSVVGHLEISSLKGKRSKKIGCLVLIELKPYTTAVPNILILWLWRTPSIHFILSFLFNWTATSPCSVQPIQYPLCRSMGKNCSRGQQILHVMDFPLSFCLQCHISLFR